MPFNSRGEETIFNQAIALPSPGARAEFLEQACGNDAELRQRMDGLLASHNGAGSFLDSPAGLTLDGTILERPGAIIGRYKLLHQIGEGGMGIVYMAEQEKPVRRRVALKVIKPGMDTRQVIARFEAERQALAMLDHQNVARVLDAGSTETGRPYFVMELVHGVPLITFCEQNRLTLRERLDLFVPICHAIQHAHQKGIIHRDIKPSNVLVTMYDDKPVPKIIDFGVAKAIDQRLTERTLFTHYGTLVGTFEYMSPEQAEMNALGVDTRSDVYSLGVLLYELLTGTTPLERDSIRNAAFGELVRMIREQEPPRPSIRLTSSGALPKIAAACRIEPARLTRLLGELDWIVMKCLEKDRARRYETANSLARDVERYLHDEPVEACPPSLRYRIAKVARKHRKAIVAAASFTGLLLLGVLVSSLLAVWAMRAQRSAQSARIDAEIALSREQAARADADAARRKSDSFAQRLARATQVANDGIDSYWRGNWTQANEQFNDAQSIEPGLNTIYIFRGALYTKLGIWDRAADDYARRFQLVTRANAQTCYEYALLMRYMRDDEGFRRACQILIDQHGGSTNNSDRYCVVRACTLSPQSVGDATFNAQRAEGLVSGAYKSWNLGLAGIAWARAGNLDRAEARLREALKTGANSPAGVHRLGNLSLAIVLKGQGRENEARAALDSGKQAIDEWAASMLHSPPGTMPFHWTGWLEGLVYYREAAELINGSVPENDPRLIAHYERAVATLTLGDALTFMNTGRACLKRRAWNEAADAFASVLEQLGGGRPSSQQSRLILEMVRQPEVFDRLVQLRPGDSRLWYTIGRLHASEKEWSSATRDFARANELLEAEFAAGRLPKLSMLHATATILLDSSASHLLAGDQQGYRALCQQMMQQYQQVEDPYVASAFSRALMLAPQSPAQIAAALQLAQLAVDRSPDTAWFRFALGAAAWRAGQSDQAIRELEESLRVHPAWIGRGQNYLILALACEDAGQHDAALKWLGQARSFLDDTDKAFAKNRFGYAGTDYLSDFLTARVLLREAEKVIPSNPQ